MFENIRLAFRGIWTHKLRSFLTMLGIIIGIAAIIAIVSTIEGTNQQIKENLIGSGSNTVDIQLYQNDWPYEMSYNAPPYGVPQVSDSLMDDIKAIPEVKSASRYTVRNIYDGVYYQNASMNGGYVKGVETDYFSTANLTVKHGRLFTDKEVNSYKKVCVIDEAIVSTLLQNEDPIGKVIEIGGDSYVVVGVVAARSTFEPVINTMADYETYKQDESGEIYIPVSDWPISYRYDEPENVLVRANSTDDMTQAGKKTADILNGNIHPDDSSIKYQSKDLLEQATRLQQLSSSTNSMLIWIAAISLLVGGIGVMNIMLVSVTERTAEIGLKKAIGARKTKIMWQFLTEAAVLTSMGGVLGVVSGIGLAKIISIMSGTPIAISWPAAMIAVVFSMVIGIVFGILPSHQAANLNPIDALRTN
ncbi:ABC transporter permease [Pseudobutyrivibrio xylanivorans]|uniref:Putative ABC transport system permease protein n=1 Tax=Pseudobutyrivibrio xylanivorans DSM 14809 TaxID=1123012 RepID=A0A1M6ERP3_PSEXY|nr:ABC transporter permease [Pseudobutyrivibrio xylanivorans]SHI87980.1 putative ABC transport system permease protein [Pseudobutyrivibrio xylanivorans DSM 14809]